MPTAEFQLELVDPDHFSLRFPYDAVLVQRLRTVKGRRWDKPAEQWIIPLSQLGTVMRLMGIEQQSLDRRMARAYQMFRIRNARVKVTVGNVVSQITGGDVPVDEIDEATSFHVPGYQFMPLYKKGRWDGRRHLFTRRNKQFPTGLLPRIVTILQSHKLEFELQPGESAKSDQPAPACRQPRLKARDYQVECIDAAMKARRGVLELATGAGKTAIAAMLIHKIGLSTLFLVHTRDLLYQTRAYFEDQLGCEIGQVGDGVVEIRPVTVATVQSCAKVLGMKVPKAGDDEEPLERDATDVRASKADILAMIQQFEVVFFDECHHLPAETFFDLAMETQAACWRFGLSATPYRADRLDLLLEAALGPKLFQANASVLIEKGYLVPPQIRFLAPPPLGPSRADGDYQAAFLRHIVTNPGRNARIAKEAAALAQKRKSVLILVSQVRHGEMLQKLMPEVPLVQGADPAESRQKVFGALERKELHVVIATTLADEGLDIPTLDAVILASGGKSETRALQRLGRALRVAPRKKEAVIIDFADQGPFVSDHARCRIEIFQSEPAFKVTVEKAPPA